MTQVEPSGEHPLIGQTIANNKYKIVRLLGEGGMGAVYLGEQALGATTRKVAVKTLHKHLSHDASIIARFEREVATVAALEHPNTIQIFDFGKMEDGTLYIVMEFVQGRSVADILEKDGAMPPQRVEHIMKQVIGSLEEAHGHGIIHRDLKPDNVVLCERAGQKDWVEVLDFGIAKRSSEHDPNEAKLTQQGMVLGTPPYMSPEQFTGQPVDVRSDIYALGVMAYEMLTGKLPWEANTAWEWASKHMTEPPTPLERQPLGPNVPDAMRNAIARSLAKNKDERFATVREFYTALTGGHGAPIGAPQVGGTAVMGAHGLNDAAAGPMSGASPGSGGGAAGAPSPRVKTEMGTPVVGGAGPAANAFSPPPVVGGGGGGGAGAAVVPAGPAHASQKKGGPPMLVIVLGGLALLLFVGAGIGIVASRKPKPTTTTSLVLGSDTASASAVPQPSDSTAVHDPNLIPSAAPPLDSSGTKIPTQVNTGGTKPPTKPSTQPVPTPTPVKVDPKPCLDARAAKAANRPAAVVKAFETQCKNAGGVP